MFDDIFGKKDDEPVNFDESSGFHAIIEPKLDELMRATREEINVPVIVIMGLSHQETDHGDHTEGNAGMLVATHGRVMDDDEDAKHGGGKWYPGIMTTLMDLLANPAILRRVHDMLPALKATMDGDEDNGVHMRGFNIEEVLKDLKAGDMPEWLRDLFKDYLEGHDDEEDD